MPCLCKCLTYLHRNAFCFLRLVLRGLLASTFFLIFFNEFLIYYVNRAAWHQIDCQLTNCTRILFVADPQLLGNTFDRAIYSGIARWDSDR